MHGSRNLPEQLGLLLIVLALALVPRPAAAQHRGIGIMVGDPTGISAKLLLADRAALVGGAAWSFLDEAALHLHADYVHYRPLQVPSDADLDTDLGWLRPALHVGAGVRFKGESDARLGVRVPVGVTLAPDDTRADGFLELVPTMDLAPATRLTLSAAVGLRYLF